MQIGVLLAAGILAFPAAGCDGPSPARAEPSDPPAVQTVAPVAGRVGSTVEVMGSGFAAADNVIRFGPGYIKGLASSRDGTRIVFSVPDGLDLCAPGVTPCAGGFQRVAAGTYPVSVISGQRESNARQFTVEE